MITQRYPDCSILLPQTLNCGESPLYDHKKNVLYWVDSGKPDIFKYDFDKQLLETIPTPADATFVAFRESGGFLLGGSKGIYIFPESGLNQKLNFSSSFAVDRLNEAIADPKGRLFTGQEAFTDDQPDNYGYLFRLEPGGMADIVEDGLSIANGMGFSPDLRIFYLIDTIPRVIYAYDYDAEKGDIKNRRVLKKFGQDEGLPDGMTIDEDGFLWVALWFGSAIVRLDPDGYQVAKIELPFSQPTSLCFGGREGTQLFITSAANYWKTPLAPEGNDYTKVRGGAVGVIETRIRGGPEFFAKL